MTPLNVCFRLDTEDFISPRSNDALLLLARMFTRQGIRATFPIVGEKWRFLQREKRTDVLRALLDHDIGYHSNTHSLHPTIAEELAGLDWQEGIRRFEERERPGYEQICDWLGRPPACYTQPGANWVPQCFPVLRRWAIPLYYGESWNAYVDTGEQPQVYGGTLYWSAQVAAPKPFLNGMPANLEQAKDCVLQQINSGSSWINIVFHPTELVHEEFWDAANFRNGKMPRREDWRQPRSRAELEIQASVTAFEEYLQWISSLRGACFPTASDIADMFDPGGCPFLPMDEVAFLAGQVEGSIRDLRGKAGFLSPAELFGVFCNVLAGYFTAGSWPAGAAVRYLEGPVTRAGMQEDELRSGRVGPGVMHRVSAVQGLEETRAAVIRVSSQLEQGFLPDCVVIQGHPWTTEGFYLLCARMVAYFWNNGSGILPEERWNVWLQEAEHACLARNRQRRPIEELHWNWPVFPRGFRPMSLWNLAGQQIWTLKEAGRR